MRRRGNVMDADVRNDGGAEGYPPLPKIDPDLSDTRRARTMPSGAARPALHVNLPQTVHRSG
jgi:hypothetical protein